MSGSRSVSPSSSASTYIPCFSACWLPFGAPGVAPPWYLHLYGGAFPLRIFCRILWGLPRHHLPSFFLAPHISPSSTSAVVSSGIPSGGSHALRWQRDLPDALLRLVSAFTGRDEAFFFAIAGSYHALVSALRVATVSI